MCNISNFRINIITYMEQYEKDIIKLLGNSLKSLRLKQNKSLNIFAYENDLTTATVSRVENGLVDTKFSTLIKYAKGLEIPLDIIIKGLDIEYKNND